MTDIINIISNIRTLCRICLSKPNCTIDIFKEMCNEEQTYNDILMECAHIQISKDDRLSSLICDSCAAYITSFISFQKQCIQSEHILKKLLNSYQLCKGQEEDYVCNLQENIDIKDQYKIFNLQNNNEKIMKLDNINNRDVLNVNNSHKQLIGTCYTDNIIRTLSKNINSKEHAKNDKLENCIEIKLEPSDEELISEPTIECMRDCYKQFSKQKTQTYFALQESVDIKNECENIHLKCKKSNIQESSSTNNAGNLNIFLSVLTDESTNNLKNNEKCNLLQCKEQENTRNTCYLKRSDKYKQFKCDLCDKVFNKKTTLIVHKTIHSCEKSSNVWHKKQLKNNLIFSSLNESNKKKVYSCNLCTKSFSSVNNICIHRRIHNLYM